MKKIICFFILSFIFISLIINQNAYANSFTTSGVESGNVVTIGPHQIFLSDNGTNTVNSLQLYNNTNLIQNINLSPGLVIPINVTTTIPNSFGQLITSTSNFHVNASYTNVNALTQTNNFLASSQTGWNGNVWAEKFIALPIGQTITDLFLYVSNLFGETEDSATSYIGTFTPFGNIYVHNLFSLPANSQITKLAFNIIDKNTGTFVNEGTSYVGSLNPYPNIQAQNLVTLPNPNGTLTNVSYNILDNHTGTFRGTSFPYTGTITPFGTIEAQNLFGMSASPNTQLLKVALDITNAGSGSGHIRFKIFSDDTGNLAGESGSIPVTTTGFQNFTLSPSITYTGTGTNPYIAFETDDPALQIQGGSNGGTSRCTVAHTYGSGPSSLAGDSCNQQNYYQQATFSVGNADIRLKVYDSLGNLLSQSGSIPVTTNGKQNFTLPTTTHTGSVYIAMETDNSGLSIGGTGAGGTSRCTVAHVYGTGPSSLAGDICGLPNIWSQVTYTVANDDIRLKVFDSSGNLLGDQQKAITVNGQQNFTLSPTITYTGNVYVGLETDNSGLSLGGLSAGGSNRCILAHVYGTGPSSLAGDTCGGTNFWSQLTYTNLNPNVRVKVYQDDGAGSGPGTLLGESGSLSVNSLGVKDFPVTATVPGSGNVWGAFETDNPQLGLKYSTGQPAGTVQRTSHVYGTGPSPFGAITSDTIPYWSEIDLSGSTTNKQIQSNTISFSPFFIPSYDKSCGVGGCSPKLVNYTAHRTPDFKHLILSVNVEPIPFNTEIEITNGTFLQSHKWYNFSSVGSVNLTASVVPTDTAYFIGYGSGVLFSGSSPGNSTIIKQGAQVFNNSFGAVIGIPAGMFVVVLFASLANQRTGPIYVIASLAVAGILSTIGYFTLDPGYWALSLIAGLLGLLVGRKIF